MSMATAYVSFITLNWGICSLTKRGIESIKCKHGMSIFLLWWPIRSLVPAFFPFSHFSHVCECVHLGINKEEMLGLGKLIILVFIHLFLSFNFTEELWLKGYGEIFLQEDIRCFKERFFPSGHVCSYTSIWVRGWGMGWNWSWVVIHQGALGCFSCNSSWFSGSILLSDSHVKSAWLG